MSKEIFWTERRLLVDKQKNSIPAELFCCIKQKSVQSTKKFVCPYVDKEFCWTNLIGFSMYIFLIISFCMEYSLILVRKKIDPVPFCRTKRTFLIFFLFFFEIQRHAPYYIFARIFISNSLFIKSRHVPDCVFIPTSLFIQLPPPFFSFSPPALPFSNGKLE